MPAFERWVAITGFDDVDAGSVPDPAAGRDTLRRARRHRRSGQRRYAGSSAAVGTRTSYVVHRTVPAVDALQAAGVDVIALKGAPLGVLAYPTMGARPMDDLDLLVPEDHAVDALRVLLDRGWQPDARRGTAVDAPGRDVGTHPAHKSQHQPQRARVSTSTCTGTPPSRGAGPVPTAACGRRRGRWSSAAARCQRSQPTTSSSSRACTGSAANLIAPIRWVTDSMLLMRDQSFDWDAVVARARELVVEPLLVLPLTYLRDRYEAPIPAWVLAALAQRRAGYLEQEWLESRMELGEKRTVAAHYGGYLRTAYADHGVQRYVGGLPGHLSALLGCSSSKELPGEVVRRGAARLRRHRKGS